MARLPIPGALVGLVMMICPLGAHATAMGAVKLDNYTFDKFVAIPGVTVLVKLDKSYAYGEKEDEFKVVAKLAYTVPKFVVAEIPVQEYGDKENDDLRERLGAKEDEFPAFFLFKGDVNKPTKFEGFADPTAKMPHDWDEEEDGAWEPPMRNEITAENLIIWLRSNGVRMPSIGTIAELDEVASKFMKDGLKDSYIEEAKKLVEGDHKNDKKAPVYLKIMQKIKEKGETYVSTETARVHKVMKGKVTPEKQAEMSDKLKILNAFAATD